MTHLRSLGEESNGDGQGQSKASRADYHLDWKVEAGPLLHERSPVRQRSKVIPQYIYIEYRAISCTDYITELRMND